MDVGTVLIVSINELIRYELLKGLKKFTGEEVRIGQIVSADNLDVALTKTILNDVALVLVDLESTRFLANKRDEDIKQELVRTIFRTPTILLTRPETLDLLEAALELGARAFLSMPLDIPELKRKLAQQLPNLGSLQSETVDEMAPLADTKSCKQLVLPPSGSALTHANAPIKPASPSDLSLGAVKPQRVPRRPDENVVGVKGRMVQGAQGHPLL